MAPANGQTTGNVPVASIDPGGTHKAPAAGGDKTRPKVESGDRNEAPNKDIHDNDTNPADA